MFQCADYTALWKTAKFRELKFMQICWIQMTNAPTTFM